jgi:hypothetical protein
MSKDKMQERGMIKKHFRIKRYRFERIHIQKYFLDESGDFFMFDSEIDEALSTKYSNLFFSILSLF